MQWYVYIYIVLTFSLVTTLRDPQPWIKEIIKEHTSRRIKCDRNQKKIHKKMGCHRPVMLFKNNDRNYLGWGRVGDAR